MGVLEYEQYSYPVDDATLAQLHAVLSDALATRPRVDVIIHFAATERVRLPITSSSRCTLYIRQWPDVCDGCVSALTAELEMSGCLNLVAAGAATRRRVRAQSDRGRTPNS